MKVAVVGAYGVGMTMRVPRFPLAGETVMGAEYAAGPGGKGSNQAIAAARLGAEVALLTALGPDHLAEDAQRLWAQEGVSFRHVVSTLLPTMVGFILVDDAGENEITIAPGALTRLAPEHVEGFREVLRCADIAVVSMEIPIPTVCAALRVAREEATTTLLNPAPAAPLPDAAWGWIDILTPNQGEAAQLLGLDEGHGLDAAQLLARLRERTDAAIVLTLGSGGSAVSVGADSYLVEPFRPERVADTTGAGDTFTAALAVAVAEGRPLAEAVRFANAAGAHAVSVAGVIDALPAREDIERVIESQQPSRSTVS